MSEALLLGEDLGSSCFVCLLEEPQSFLLNYIGVNLKMVFHFTQGQARDYIFFCAVTHWFVTQ